MAVDYEDLERRRRTGYLGGNNPSPTVSTGPSNSPYPAAAGKGVSRPTINRPNANRQVNRPRQEGGGGLASMLRGTANWGRKMTRGPISGALGGAEIGRSAGLAGGGIEDLLAGMPGAFNGNILSFLSQARQAIGDGGLGDALNTIANREANYKEQAKQGDARLAAMYDQLRNSILADSEKISGNTNEAREGMREIATNEQTAINDAYQATQARQDEILGRLGIDDAQAIGIAQGDVQGASRNQAIERAATRDAAAQEYTTSVGQNAQNLNISNAAAAGMEGADRRADLGTQLASALAALQDERAATTNEFNSRNQQMAMSLASQLFDNARSNWQSQMDNWRNRFDISQGLDDRAFDQSMSLREMALREQAAAAEAAAASQPGQVPWNQLAPFEQFNQQLSRGVGNNAPQVAQILGRHMRADVNRGATVDITRAAEQLAAELNMDPYEAYMIASSAAQSMG